MLIIRLQRTGRKNHPDFRVVLAEKHRAASKKVVEVFGQYNPRTKELHLKDKDRLVAWVSKNVEISPTVRNLLVSKQLITGTKVKAWRPKVKEQTEEATKPAESQATEKPAEQKTVEKPTEKKAENKSEKPEEKKHEPEKAKEELAK